MIELDVRMTKDFELVVIHDRDVRRTTTGSGSVCDLTLPEIGRLDAGSWFSPRFTGEGVPTLRQVMDFLPPAVQLNIEVKTDGERRPRITIAERVVRTIQGKTFQRRALVSSFDHAFLRHFHALATEILIGALLMPVRDMTKRPSTLARTLGASWLVCAVSQVRRRFVERAHESGLGVACYTVNSITQLQRVHRYGVDAVITNYPQRILHLLQ